MEELFSLAVQGMIQKERQDQAFAEIFAAFTADGIDFLPLKGLNLAKLYPKPEMRTMGDFDILIRQEQYDRIQKCMKTLGFSFVREYHHELVWQRGSVSVELHRSLADTDDKAHAYFGDGWHLAKKGADGTYRLSAEDELVYLFYHFSKHYRGAGIGIKHLTDLWVYLKAHPQLEDGYVRRELDKLGLLRFYENVCKTLQAWFADGAWDPITERITEEILSGGQYGTASNRTSARILRAGAGDISGGRRKLVWKRIFLPYEDMKQRYPALKRMPFLLPIFCVGRWGRILVCKQREIRSFLRKDGGNSDASLEQRRNSLKQVGLDGDF